MELEQETGSLRAWARCDATQYNTTRCDAVALWSFFVVNHSTPLPIESAPPFQSSPVFSPPPFASRHCCVCVKINHGDRCGRLDATDRLCKLSQCNVFAGLQYYRGFGLHRTVNDFTREEENVRRPLVRPRRARSDRSRRDHERRTHAPWPTTC